MSDEIDYEAEYASLYQAVLDAGLHIIDGPKGRAVQMPLDASLRELLLDDRTRDLEKHLADRDAQWERACHDILFRYEGVNIASHDLVARIKARLDAEQEQKEVGRE